MICCHLGACFCRFLYSVIACCSLASVSARSGSLGRGMVVVEDNDFNLVARYAPILLKDLHNICHNLTRYLTRREDKLSLDRIPGTWYSHRDAQFCRTSTLRRADESALD